MSRSSLYEDHTVQAQLLEAMNYNEGKNCGSCKYKSDRDVGPEKTYCNLNRAVPVMVDKKGMCDFYDKV